MFERDLWHMKYFLDTEFNGFGGELLSIGIVPLTGSREFYEAVEYELIRLDPWVRDNVIPFIDKKPIPHSVLQHRLAAFFSQDSSPVIVVDWPDDIKYFCDLLITGPGQMLLTPNFTFELRRELDCATAAIRHNALSDAIALRYSYLQQEKRDFENDKWA